MELKLSRCSLTLGTTLQVMAPSSLARGYVRDYAFWFLSFCTWKFLEPTSTSTSSFHALLSGISKFSLLSSHSHFHHFLPLACAESRSILANLEGSCAAYQEGNPLRFRLSSPTKFSNFQYHGKMTFALTNASIRPSRVAALSRPTCRASVRPAVRRNLVVYAGVSFTSDSNEQSII